MYSDGAMRVIGSLMETVRRDNEREAEQEKLRDPAGWRLRALSRLDDEQFDMLCSIHRAIGRLEAEGVLIWDRPDQGAWTVTIRGERSS